MAFLPGCCAPKRAAPFADDDANEACCIPLVQARLEGIEVQENGHVLRGSGVEAEKENLSEIDLSEDASVRKARDYILQAVEFRKEDLLDKAVLRLQFALSILEFVPQDAPTTIRLQQACLKDSDLQVTLVDLAKSGRVKISTLHDVRVLRDTLMVKEQRREERRSARRHPSHTNLKPLSIARASSIGKQDEAESESSGDSDVESMDFEGAGAAIHRERRMSMADLAESRQTEQDRMREIQDFCKCGRFLDAYRSLKDLIESSQTKEEIKEECVKELRLLGGQTSKVGALNLFLSDPVICNLERVRAHIQRALHREKISAVKDGEDWAHIQVRNAYLHEDYSCEFWVRLAKGAERYAAGPPTQVLWSAKHENVPLNLKHVVSIYREIDLFRKSWIPKCKYFEGVKAGPEKLDAMFINYHSSEIPFMHHEESSAQFMFVWPEAGSVVIVGVNPPANARTFEGFPTRPHRNGSPFIPDVTSTTYISPHPTNPGMCSITMSGTRGFRLPEWMLNMSMIKHFMARNQMLLLHNMLEGWSGEQEKYNKRTKGDAKFYTQVSNLSLATGAGSWLIPDEPDMDK